MPANTTIQYRRGTTAQWSAANPILAVGEPGYDTTVNDFKMGDGVTAWNSLAFYSTLAGSKALGTSSNPVTNPTAARPTGLPSVWWVTPTQPTNWQPGDIWMVSP